MKCPDCGSDTKILDCDYYTAVMPRETRLCPSCNRKLMIFDVEGEDDLVAWKDERQPGTSFSVFVLEELKKRTLQKMN